MIIAPSQETPEAWGERASPMNKAAGIGFMLMGAGAIGAMGAESNNTEVKELADRMQRS
jgi:hypothetical protein